MRVVESPSEVARAGDWVVEATAQGRWGYVDALLPAVFERYARLFHPAVRDDGLGEVTWREVAEANDRTAHPAMEWTSITGHYDYEWNGRQQGLWEQAPEHGTLPVRRIGRLCALLGGFTHTPDRCWCAIWDGYGDLVGSRFDDRLPRLPMRHRPMLVTCGPLDAVRETSFTDSESDASWSPNRSRVESFRSPSLWWPDDRVWCVATDVDLMTTYVGGSASCVDRLVADEQLEAMVVPGDQSVMFDADTVNPTPSGQRGWR